MSTLVIGDIIDAVRADLGDPSGSRFTDAVMLEYANDCGLEVVIFKPNAFVVNAARQLAAGTKQSLPSGAVVLLDVRRNMGTEGLTPGPVPTRGDLERMNRTVPDWHTHTADAEVTDWLFDEKADPTTYYVYPPQPGASQGYLEEVYSSAPTEMTAPNDTIPLDDIYKPHYENYLKARALAKNAKSLNTGEAGNYYQVFLQLLGVKMKSERGARRADQSQ